MRRLDLTPYDVEVVGAEGPHRLPYDLAGSVGGLLFHPDLKLSARDLVGRQGLAERIAAGGVVLLEDAEYAVVLAAVEAFRGFTRNDLGMVQRVLDAPIVTVEEVCNP